MPRGGHDIPVSGTHLKGTPWLRRVWTPQYQSSESTQLIYISEGCPQIKTKVLIRVLGRFEGVGEDSGYEMIS